MGEEYMETLYSVFVNFSADLKLFQNKICMCLAFCY